MGTGGSAVLPESALEVADPGKGDPIEPGDVLFVHGPTECPSVLFSLVPVLGPGYRNGHPLPSPSSGPLGSVLCPVLVTDASQLGDDTVDDRHGMFGKVAFAGGRMGPLSTFL